MHAATGASLRFENDHFVAKLEQLLGGGEACQSRPDDRHALLPPRSVVVKHTLSVGQDGRRDTKIDVSCLLYTSPSPRD